MRKKSQTTLLNLALKELSTSGTKCLANSQVACAFHLCTGITIYANYGESETCKRQTAAWT